MPRPQDDDCTYELVETTDKMRYGRSQKPSSKSARSSATLDLNHNKMYRDYFESAYVIQVRAMMSPTKLEMYSMRSSIV